MDGEIVPEPEFSEVLVRLDLPLAVGVGSLGGGAEKSVELAEFFTVGGGGVDGESSVPDC